MTDFERQLRNYRLTTAQILYHLPDHPLLPQMYIWQEYDLQPDFPTLQRFLDFWEHNLEGRLHSVRIASVKLIQPAELRHLPQEFRLH